jgi:alpha-D-xyloside xylohydrolase
MKFTDGVWLPREGVTASYAIEVADVAVTDDRLVLHATTRKVARRGDTLNSALITVDCCSPAEGVIGVRLTHHAGAARRGPEFDVRADPGHSAHTTHTGTVVSLTSGELTLRVDTARPWALEFRDGADRLLTRSGAKGTAFAINSDGSHHMVSRLSLDVGELVYGLGERFTPFVRNGQTVDIWQADGGTGSDQAYKNVPFHLTNRGYGVFVNHPGPVSYEIASEAVGEVQFSVEDQTMEYFVVHGPTPKDVLRRYTALTGRPALPPAWSFGLWLTTSFTTSYDEETVSSFVQGMADREIPLHVFHFDCFWMREYQWCDFTWDPRAFPDPEGMLRRLKERGLRISLWINPYIAQKSPLFAEAAAAGFLVRRADGGVWQWDMWQPGMALVDFTDPGARAWYADKLRPLLAMGVDCFKTDFGERVPTDVVWHDGSDPTRMHNYYAHLYNETVFELLRQERGEGEAVVFARCATAGGQQYPVHWSGDSDATFSSMAECLRGGLSLGMSGFGFWSHDIGGFEHTPSDDLFKRWLAFGMLSSHSRLHGSGSYRVPWQFGEEAVVVAREFVRLKNRLMPYLYGAAVEASRTGVPVMRPMVLEFPDDPGCAHLDRQYLLGPDLLVAPVFDADGAVEYYVPAGTWTHLLSGATVTGPGWHREKHGFESLPLLVRPGAVLPLGAHGDRPDYTWSDGITLRVHRLADGGRTTVAVPDESGGTAAVFTARRVGDLLRVEGRWETAAPGPWQVLVVGEPDAVTVPDAGQVEQSPLGALVHADAGVTSMALRIGPDRR